MPGYEGDGDQAYKFMQLKSREGLGGRVRAAVGEKLEDREPNSSGDTLRSWCPWQGRFQG